MAMRFKIFDQVADLSYGISEKSDGAMELAKAGLAEAKHRSDFFTRQGIDPAKTISLRQPHSAIVKKVGADDLGKVAANVDGLVADAAGLILTVTVADCFPIYFFNQVSRAVGLVHSGWRGTAANIAGEAVKVMPGNPTDVIAGIGPGIQGCHFEIKEDILEKFFQYPEAINHHGNKIFIDLPKIISRQLISAGLKHQNIENCGECTYCLKEKYFSFRRDKPKSVEAMLAYIGLL